MNAIRGASPLHTEIRETINTIVKTGPISLADDADLFASDTLDSFNMIELIAHLEERYAIGFEMEDLTNDNFGSIAAIAGLVDRYRSGA